MRRLITSFAALSLVAAACGGSGTGGSEPSDTTTATDTAVSEAPTDTVAPAGTEPPGSEPAPSAPADTTLVDEAPTDSTAPSDPDATDATAAQSATTEPAEGLDEFVVLEPGPYAVGVQTITISDTTRDRPLTTEVWFPLADGVQGEAHRYVFVTGDYYESPTAISADASAIAPDGPFPLVAYSHGSGGVRYQSSFLTEFLASHGYIVAAPEHTGNTAIDLVIAAAEEAAGGAETSDDDPNDVEEEPTPEELAQVRQIALDRVLDIQRVVDAFLDAESTETVGFVGSVDPQRIAVSGHSFGGFTSYAVVSGYDNEFGTAQPDLRIGAIVPLAPAVGDGGENSLLSDDRLASVDIPALVMVGTNDQTTPADPNVERAFGLGTGSPSYRADLIDAQHFSFTDACDYAEFLPQLPDPTPAVVQVVEGFAEEGCSPDDMPIDRVKDLTDTFAVSFLDSVFRDGTMITEEDPTLPTDVIFESK